MNKVLNRPMFRQKALRQGALKPIHAQTGVMVGAPTQDIRNTQFRPPAINTQGFVGRQIRPRLQRFANIAGKTIADIKNFPTSSVGQVTRPNVKIPFGMGGGVGRLLGGTGLYQGVSNVTSKLGFKDDSLLKSGIDLGISGLLFMNPYARAAGLAYGGFNLARSALGAGVDYVAQKPPGTTKQALSIDRGEPIFEEGVLETGIKNLFTPIDGSRKRRKDPKRLEVMNQKIQENIAAQEAAGLLPRSRSRREAVVERMKRLNFEKEGKAIQEAMEKGEEYNKRLADEGDQIAQNANEEGGAANLNVIQQDGITNYEDTPLEAQERGEAIGEALNRLNTKLPEEDPKEKKQIDENDTRVGDNNINFGGASSDPDFNKTQQLARKYYKELRAGEGSQANLIFLANLASGLLTGTTRKAGVGGALEVLGQALGPAVNNYATIKLKEGELRANAREASLSAALDHMKALNTAAEIDYPDRTSGVIQITGADGELQNINGFQLKDGTIQIATGIDRNTGRETFSSISQSEPLTVDGKVIGTFTNFLPKKAIQERLFDISDTLGNRYTAYATSLDVLKTLNQPDRNVKAGAALTVDAVVRRLGGAAAELLGRDISGASVDQMKELGKKLMQDEFDAIDRSDLSDEAKEKAKEEISFDSIYGKALARIQKGDKGGFLSGLTREEQERLAVQEVTLVYALANTFKDQDRLTQRDINAAREIVNIFSLTRSSADVKASIKAISENLEKDIRRQERLFTAAGGLTSSINQLRKLKGFDTDIANIEGSLYEALGEKEFLDEFNKQMGNL